MRRLLAPLAVPLACLLMAPLTPTAAAAETPGCVTRKELRQLAKGMTVTEVRDLVGNAGELYQRRQGGFVQGYRACRGGGVLVTFGNDEDAGGDVVVAKKRVRVPVVDCVTRAEWRKVYIVPDGTGSGPGKGGGPKRVHRIFGTKGRVVDRFHTGANQPWVIREYPRCGSRKTYTVSFMRLGNDPWGSYWG